MRDSLPLSHPLSFPPSLLPLLMLLSLWQCEGQIRGILSEGDVKERMEWKAAASLLPPTRILSTIHLSFVALHLVYKNYSRL